MKDVDTATTLHDMNSKVWIIDKQYVSGINIAPVRKRMKDVLVFYSSGTFFLQNIQNLDEPGGRRGKYFYSSEKKVLNMDFYGDENAESWELHLKDISPDSILMDRVSKDEKEQYSILLKPFPKL